MSTSRHDHYAPDVETPPEEQTAPPAAAPSNVSRLTSAWLTQFVVGTDLFVVSPLMPELSHGLGEPLSAMGLALTCFSVAYIAGAPLLGRFGDRRGRLVVLTLSLAVFTFGNLATALAPDYPLFLAARVIAGVAAAGTGPTVYALIGAAAPAERRGSHLALVGSGLLSALWAGAPLGSVAAHHWGWRVVFAALAAGTVVLAWVNWRLWRDTPGTRAPKQSAAQQAGHGEQTSARVSGRLITGVSALWALGVYLLYTFLGSALNQRHDDGWTVWMLVAYGVGAVPGSLLGGRLADRLGAARTVTTALLLTTGLEALVAAAFSSRNAVWLTASLLLFALCAYAAFPAQQRRLLDRFPQEAASLMGWNNSALFLGISVAGVVGPLLLDSPGYCGTVLVGAAACLTAAAASAALARSSKRSSSQP